MNIDGVNLNNQTTELKTQQKELKVNVDKGETKSISKEKPAAVYEKTNEKNTDIGTIYNKDAILKLKQATENNRLKIIEMIQKSINRQNKAWGMSNLTSEIVGLDKQAIEEAESMLAEDGYLGVEKTSQRLVDFAIAISGGDTSKAELLRNAIDKGFSEARKMLGGKLPKISEDTYTATMKKFDAWAAGNQVDKDGNIE